MEISKRFLCLYHLNIIESQRNLEGLRNLLKYENNDDGKNKCLNWLNNYIIFMEKNSKIIGKLKIFPNQKGNFELLNNLRYDESIPEMLKDIYNKLFSTKEKQFEIRNILLCHQITAYKDHNKFTQEEIIALIEKKFKNLINIELKTYISENLLKFLPIHNEDVSNALRQFIPYYNFIFNKNINLRNMETTIEINYGIFLKHILTETYKFIEQITEQDISSKVDIIAKTIEFGWKNQENDKLNLLVDPSKYKIFVNANNKFDKMENLKFTLDFQINDENIKNLIETAKLSPINCDFNNNILCPSFINILAAYKKKFKTLEINEICKNEIDSRLIDYYKNNYNKNLLDNEYKSFRNVFFKLNGILKRASYLKKYFPRFEKNKGQICLKFLDENEYLDYFIEDVEIVVEFKTAS